MRRGLLIAFTIVVLLSAVPVLAEGPTGWQGIDFGWWSYLASLWPGPGIQSISQSEEALPHLDPNGLELPEPDPDIEYAETLDSIELEPSANALPHLDPNG